MGVSDLRCMQCPRVDFICVTITIDTNLTKFILIINATGAAAEVARAISPTAPKVDSEEDEAFVSPSQSENPRGRIGRFMYMVTSTRTKTVYKITATTAVTFVCTPKSSILNMCK